MIVDIHVHTSASRCSNMSPRAMEKAALRAGLDGVVIADHDTQAGYNSAKRECRKIKVYPGVEVTTQEGEVLALFFEGEIDRGLHLVDAVERIRVGGGLVVIPHPFDFLRSGVGNNIELVKPDAVEVFNSRCLLPVFNSLARRFAARHNLLAVSGSDAHFPGEVGRAAMGAGGDFEEEFRKGKVKVVRERYSPPTVHLQTLIAKLL